MPNEFGTTILLPIEIRGDLAPGFCIPFEDRVAGRIFGEPGFGAIDQVEERSVARIRREVRVAATRLDPGDSRP